jgi:hypothetical protein
MGAPANCGAPVWKGGVEVAAGGGVWGDLSTRGGVLATDPLPLLEAAGEEGGGSWECTLLEDPPPNTELDPRVMNGMTTTPSESPTEALEGGDSGGEGEEGEDCRLLGSSYEVARVIKDTVANSPLVSPTCASDLEARAVEESGEAVDDSLGTPPLFGGGMRMVGALCGPGFSSSATSKEVVGERRGGG